MYNFIYIDLIRNLTAKQKKINLFTRCKRLSQFNWHSLVPRDGLRASRLDVLRDPVQEVSHSGVETGQLGPSAANPSRDYPHHLHSFPLPYHQRSSAVGLHNIQKPQALLNIFIFLLILVDKMYEAYGIMVTKDKFNP